MTDETPSYSIEALLAAVMEQLPADDPRKCAETLAGMDRRAAERADADHPTDPNA